MNIILPVEIMAGTSIRTAVIECKALSEKLGGISIEFKFNSVGLYVNSRSNIEEKVESYWARHNSRRKK